MDIARTVAELRQELERINTAIASLERLHYGADAAIRPDAAAPKSGRRKSSESVAVRKPSRRQGLR